MSKISVLCKLPQGCILEGGYEYRDGGMFKSSDYFSITLAGANQHSVELGNGMRTPSPKDLKPGITHNVDEALFDKWVAAHRDTNVVRNGLVMKVTKAKDAEPIAKELAAQKTGMEPTDPNKHPGLKKLSLTDDARVE